jgi:hypothetical protein
MYALVMVDPITGVVAGAVAKAGTDAAGGLVTQWLGPLAKESGEDLARAYRGVIDRILARGARKTDLAHQGVVSARVAGAVFRNAQWTDDEFVTEYLSGVLASARTEDGSNDGGVSWASLVGRMSSDQLRLHYVLYAGLRNTIVSESATGVWPWVRRHLVIDYGSLFSALGWEYHGIRDVHRIYEAGYGLQRDDCIQDFTHGGGDYLRDTVSWTRGHSFDPNLGYIAFRASATGIGLFLNGHGHGASWYDAFEDPSTDCDTSFDSGDVQAAPVRFADTYPRVSESG